MKHTGFKAIVIVLLAALLAVEGGRFYVQWQQWIMASAINDTGQAQLQVAREQLGLARQAEDRRVEQARIIGDFNTTTDAAISGFLDDYNQNAYHGNLTRIAEQQLTAAEYTLLGLQLLLRQNQLLLQLLAQK